MCRRKRLKTESKTPQGHSPPPRAGLSRKDSLSWRFCTGLLPMATHGQSCPLTPQISGLTPVLTSHDLIVEPCGPSADLSHDPGVDLHMIPVLTYWTSALTPEDT